MPWDRMDIALSIRVFLHSLGKPLYILLEVLILGIISIFTFAHKIFLQLTKLLISISHWIFHQILLSASSLDLFVHKVDRIRNKALSGIKPPPYQQLTTHQRIKPLLKHFYQYAHSLILSVHKLRSLFTLPHIKLPPIKIALPALPQFVFPQFKLKLGLQLISTLSLLSLVYLFYLTILKDLPHPKNLLSMHQPVTSTIFDSKGQILYNMFKDEDRSIVSLDNIPLHVIQATLAIEDADFYQHAGFSIRGIIRSVQNNLSEDSLHGGSTITQQLIKNTLLNSEKTYIRKIKEIVLALMVESYFTKDEILTMYFNEVPFGGTAYGIQAASQMYFNKSVGDLNLAEAAFLAGLPAAPTTYSPYGPNPELSTVRQREVLRRMTEEGNISQQLSNIAQQTPLTIAPPRNDIKAPHFVMYVKDQLVSKYGETTTSQGGLKITTSLDYELQQFVESVIQSEIENLRTLKVTNAAAIVTRPHTGEVLAMVGSTDFFDVKNDGQVNVSLRPRQPGSSIKPVNYAMAIENGFTAATQIVDAPITYTTVGSPPYSPKNYDGRYHGRVTLRSALANSYNIPAVKTLNEFGVSRMVNMGQALGITTWNNPSRFGLALTLGGGEVTLADMTVVYGTFANYGLKVDLHPIKEVTNYSGTKHDELGCDDIPTKLAFPAKAHAQNQNGPCQAQPVLSDSTAFIISDILSDNNARTPTFGRHSILSIKDHQVAVKTGTTNNLRDNWTIGYTSNYLVGVWVGNNDNTPMSRIASGITGASPIWNTIMTKVLENEPPQIFPLPSSIIKVNICPLTGSLSCHACPNSKAEYFVKGTEPTKACSEEVIRKIIEEQATQQL